MGQISDSLGILPEQQNKQKHEAKEAVYAVEMAPGTTIIVSTPGLKMASQMLTMLRQISAVHLIFNRREKITRQCN